jgi:hypothetical protein
MHEFELTSNIWINFHNVTNQYLNRNRKEILYDDILGYFIFHPPNKAYTGSSYKPMSTKRQTYSKLLVLSSCWIFFLIWEFYNKVIRVSVLQNITLQLSFVKGNYNIATIFILQVVLNINGVLYGTYMSQLIKVTSWRRQKLALLDHNQCKNDWK